MASDRIPIAWCKNFYARGQSIHNSAYTLRMYSVEKLKVIWSRHEPGDRYEECGCGRPIIMSSYESRSGHYGCGDCTQCENCCSCVWCSECGGECHDDYCGDCNECTSCCSCIHCEYCGRRVESRCNDCNNGDCHCDCTSDSDDEESDPPPKRRHVKFFESELTFHASKAHERKVNPSRRFIAVEIEVASTARESGIEAAVRKWRGSIVSDGSLPSSGFEINTAPAAGDKFTSQVGDICRALQASAASVNTDCGLHVHVDARDFDYYMIRRLVNVYAEIEPALFAMASKSRQTSTYCIPCGPKYKEMMARGLSPYKLAKSKIIQTVYSFDTESMSTHPNVGERRYQAERLKELKHSKYYNARYNALNLHSWFHRGTIECRLFNGTVNEEKIACWGMLWATILDYVASHTDKEVAADMRGTSNEILCKIAQSPRLIAFIKERTEKFADRLTVAA